jgi:hypothetical protein
MRRQQPLPHKLPPPPHHWKVPAGILPFYSGIQHGNLTQVPQELGTGFWAVLSRPHRRAAHANAPGRPGRCRGQRSGARPADCWPFAGRAVSTAPELLQRSAELLAERGKQYDQPGGERSMARTVAAFNVITDRDLTESEGWLLLQLLKDVRDRRREKPHRDSLEDGITYSALKAEARLNE